MGALNLPKLCLACGDDVPYGISDYCYLCIVTGDTPDDDQEEVGSDARA